MPLLGEELNIFTALPCKIEKISDIEKIHNAISKEKYSFAIVISNNAKAYEKLNEIFLEHSLPWISCRVMPNHAEIGPLIIPRKTACFNCYIKRLLSHGQKIFRNYKKVEKWKVIASFAFLYADILRFLQKKVPGFLGKIGIMDFENFKFETHKIYKLPWCDVCGKPRDYLRKNAKNC